MIGLGSVHLHCSMAYLYYQPNFDEEKTDGYAK